MKLMKSKMRSSIVDILLAMIVALSTLQLYSMWFISNGGSVWLNAVASSYEYRPFVYRVLVPWTSQLLQWLTGIEAWRWIIPIILTSSVGLYLALKNLLVLTGKTRKSAQLISFISIEIFLLTLLVFPKVYDIPTAFLFTVAITFMYKRKWLNYMLLFPLITLNRETSFLLIIITLFWLIKWRISWQLTSWNMLKVTLYQIITYISIRVFLTRTYAYLPGDNFQWWFEMNIHHYLKFPLATLLLLFGLATVTTLCVLGARRLDDFFGVCFYLIFPMQVILYFTLGFSFEIRVFAESLPLLAVLLPQGIEEVHQHINNIQPIGELRNEAGR